MQWLLCIRNLASWESRLGAFKAEVQEALVRQSAGIGGLAQEMRSAFTGFLDRAEQMFAQQRGQAAPTPPVAPVAVPTANPVAGGPRQLPTTLGPQEASGYEERFDPRVVEAPTKFSGTSALALQDFLVKLIDWCKTTGISYVPQQHWHVQ